MRYLIVGAHPDDEALGAGGLIHNVTAKGDQVYTCILSHWSPTRSDNLLEGIKKSDEHLGVTKSFIGDFSCLRFKDADHHEMVRFIESSIMKCKPDVIITHHPADVNIDHGVVTECCLEAAKLPQRQICEIPPIKKILFMEVPSSTDWNINTVAGSFQPNYFFEVSKEDIEHKINAVSVYDKVIRKQPHPRSVEYIEALAVVRGAQAGVKYAEAFQLMFELEV